MSPAALRKILFLFRGTRLFNRNHILHCQQIFNQLLPLFRGELMDVHAVGAVSD